MTHGTLRIKFYLHNIVAEHFVERLSSKGVSSENNERFIVC